MRSPVPMPGLPIINYYWLDDRRAPDFARTVDIHRQPGYDPVELFFDPQLKLPQAVENNHTSVRIVVTN